MADTVTAIGNPEYKDRLFKFIFGKETEESKRWRLQLYNALNGTNFKNPDELKINTIENVIYITMHNDISFLVDTEMNLYEEQSSYNPNMPLRGYLYFAILYQKYLKDNKKNLISSTRVMIPNPKFYVFYHGGPKKPERWKMKLSDSFMNKDDSGDFQCTATVINLHPNHNSLLNKKCVPLYDYVRFVSKILEYKKSGMSNEEAIEKAVDYAIANNFLEGFFELHKAEVMGMCLTEFDEEEAKRIWHEDGYTEGLAEGESRKTIEAAKGLYNNGVSLEIIAKSLNITIDQVKKIIFETEAVEL
ncbi:MAG: hypothetical protein IJ688_12195 [Treponema sp.]|nr:hypothetical protein [Treponema sp.]